MKRFLLVLGVFLLAIPTLFAAPKASGFGDMNHSLVLTPGAGLVFPAGDFNDANDLGFSVGAGLEYFVSPRVALSFRYDYLSFSDPGLSAAGENFHFIGAGARGFLYKDARLNPYLKAAGGLYQGNSRSSAGASAGPGLLYRVSKNVGLFAEGNAHFVFDYGVSFASATANFLEAKAGLFLTLPTGKKRPAARQNGNGAPRFTSTEKKEEPKVREKAKPAKAETVLQTIYFDFDLYDLRSDAKATLKKNALVLRAHSGLKIALQGHCDEIGTEEYNMELGWKRAEAARKFLVESGLDDSRFTKISYGKKRPAVKGGGNGWRAKNRRVEFKIISQ